MLHLIYNFHLTQSWAGQTLHPHPAVALKEGHPAGPLFDHLYSGALLNTVIQHRWLS